MSNMKKDYVQEDSMGYLFNSEFKPDFAKNGSRYHGYRTNNQEALFYYIAVLGYDLQFDYNGQRYYFLSEQDHIARCEQDFKTELEVFDDANTMFKSFKIDGIPLINLVDKLESVETL